MTHVTQKDPNRGPLKLQHDLTPRDLSGYNPSADELNSYGDFRYRGFPVGNFESPRQAMDKVDHEQFKAPPLDQNHHLPSWFDTRDPRVHRGAKGIQYGSDGLPRTDVAPRPMRNPLEDKSSAELLKLRQQFNEAEDDIRKYKQEKLQKLQMTEDEKKRDLDQLKAYNPWGRPGGGAPMNSDDPNTPRSVANKKMKFTEEDLSKAKIEFPKVGPNKEYVQEYGDFHSGFGKPGAGAPLRTGSGQLKTELRGDEQIRFQDTHQGRKVFENEVRYKQDPSQKQHYQKDLQSQIAQKAMHNQEERMSDLRKELEMLRHDPYGKPGAGAPNHTRSGHHLMTARMTTLTNDLVELRRSRERDGTTNLNRANSEFNYDPWGKGTGQPRRDQYGETARYKFADRDMGVITKSELNGEGNSLDLANTKGGAGAPMMNPGGEVQTRMPITLKRNEQGDASIKEEAARGQRYIASATSDPELQIYDPWGKGGSGAPLKDSRGNVVTNVFGKIKHERNSGDERVQKQAQQVYLNELQREMQEQRKQREDQDRDLRQGAGELASVMKQGQVGRPKRDPYTGMLVNQHLGTTDATRERTNERRMVNNDTQQYHTDLEKAAEERKRIQQLDKLKERQETRYHQSTYADYWGKPGGGAPLEGKKKANLDQILFSPRREPDDFYSKRIDGDKKPYNYIRNTVGSMHTNQYEYESPNRRGQNRDYKLSAPFALVQE